MYAQRKKQQRVPVSPKKKQLVKKKTFFVRPVVNKLPDEPPVFTMPPPENLVYTIPPAYDSVENSYPMTLELQPDFYTTTPSPFF